MSSLIWQAVLLGLWGVPTLIFMPIFLRSADHEIMAAVLVAQVYVNYLAMFVQFGFPWTGPAAIIKAQTYNESFGFWRKTIWLKLRIFALVVSGFAAGVCFSGQYYALAYSLPLFAQALNSNWFLQAKGNYKAGVFFSFVGVCAGSILLALQSQGLGGMAQGTVVITALMMPQILLGIGTYLAIRSTNMLSTPTCLTARFSQGSVKEDLFFVSSQLLLIFSSTLGTLAISYVGDASLTTAYAATEKLFNLVSNGLVGLFMGVYPKLARSFYRNKHHYVSNVKKILLGTTVFSALALLIILVDGEYLLGLYLGNRLASLVYPALVPLGVWLMLCIGQHLLTAHLVLIHRRAMVLWTHAGVLLTTIVVGLLAMLFNPLYWVYGMCAGQIFSFVILGSMYWRSAAYKERRASI